MKPEIWWRLERGFNMGDGRMGTYEAGGEPHCGVFRCGRRPIRYCFSASRTFEKVEKFLRL